MSCFFCDSFYHLSQNCNVFGTDEIRQLIAKTKRRCSLCLKLLDLNHDEWGCDLNKCCCECFSQDHHTFFCPNIVTKFFVPNVDRDLFLRFLQTFDRVEQHFLTTLSPSTVNFLPIKQLRIVKEFKLTRYTYRLNADDIKVIVADKLEVTSYSTTSKFISSYMPEIITNKAKNVIIKDVGISTAELLLLLTPHTQTLICDSVVFEQKIVISDILSNTPNLKIVEFDHTYFTHTWPEDLLKVKNLNKLKSFKMFILILIFEVDALAAFMKKTQTDVILRVSGLSPPSQSRIVLDKLCENNFSRQKPSNTDTSQIPQFTIKYQSQTFKYFLV